MSDRKGAVEDRDEDELEAADEPQIEGEDEPGEGEESEEDDRLGAVDREDETDEQRERREKRERKKRGKDRRRQFQAQEQAELVALREENRQFRGRLDALEGGAASGQRARIDEAIGQTQHMLKVLRERRAKAIADIDGNAADALDEDIYNARRRLETLQAAKQDAGPQQQRDGGIDPAVRTQLATWQSRNGWFNPVGEDEDSHVARAVDKALLKEGRFNPGTAAYWQELDTRLKRKLPHRYRSRSARQDDAEDFDDDGDDAEDQGGEEPRRKNPPLRGSSGRRGDSAGGFVWSKERVQAAKEAGKWSDTKQRKELENYYRAYDRENGRR